MKTGDKGRGGGRRRKKEDGRKRRVEREGTDVWLKGREETRDQRRGEQRISTDEERGGERMKRSGETKKHKEEG